MEHSQQVFEADQEQRVSRFLLVLRHSEQVSEFFVDLETKKQVKQNDKHEVHLLVLQTHFVVPGLESLDSEMAERLGMVEVARTRSVLGKLAGKMLGAVERMAGTIGAAVHTGFVEVVGFARSPSAALHR